MYVVGIDLGTSNCAVAYAAPGYGPRAEVSVFPVPQLIAAGQVTPQSLLPSCIYLPAEHELPADALRLPWGGDGRVVGAFARVQGARVPGRLVASAKSWLCHPNVDRTAPILPWGAPVDVPRLSPVEASALLLQHMAAAWDAQHPDTPLREQEVVLTVPASFDEAARALTVNAARQAGLEKFTLLEEPQAAFYDYIARQGVTLAAALEGIRLVLVVDVGGGTTDFTLVQVGGVSGEEPVLRRIAVGDHLLLGGDNMDAALGRRIEERLTAGRRALSPAQWHQLTQACRMAKEALLGSAASDRYNVSVAGEGSRLVGGSLSSHLERAEAEAVVLDGFFPACRSTERPARAARTGLRELGLPYAPDPAITRHLAAFLAAHAPAGWAALGQADAPVHALPRPDALLLNGGVFNSPKLAQRLVEVVSQWWPDAPPIRILEHDTMDLAVARGAAHYGLARHGLGRRIGGGTAHAFYVGLEKQGSGESLALCVIPRGHEEGQTVELSGRVFRLTLGRPVQFPLFTTTSDRVERAGDVIPIADDLLPLPPIHALLQTARPRTGELPVHLRATLTEIGTLELWCVAEQTGEQWRLEFELRGSGASGTPPAVVEPMPPRFAEASRWVNMIFGGRGAAQGAEAGEGAPRDVKQLWVSLEKSLGPRDQWRVAVLRELWGGLRAGASRRRRSPDHERIFYQLAGYTLRPGVGYPLDEWRCEQSAAWFAEGVEHHKFKPVWTEFWVLWRRIAGGLSESRQAEMWAYLKPYLERRLAVPAPGKGGKVKGVQPEGWDEMVRLAASLEHLPVAEKTELGGWLVARLNDPAGTSGPWAWALGRLGARVPLHGSIHRTVPPEVAAEWLAALLAPAWIKTDGALFAVAQIARRTGDRARDLADSARQAALAALTAAAVPASWPRMVNEVVALEAEDEARALGDSLPVGLKLV